VTDLILALHRATHATLRALARDLADFDLTNSETNVLAVLADRVPRTVGVLAAATATRSTTLTNVLDRLVVRGLVMREVDPEDRRSFVVVLTDTGRETAAAVDAAVQRLERSALSAIGQRELAGFRAVLDALMEGSR
jgi:DNA-binding MarR family transcriptional regulator